MVRFISFFFLVYLYSVCTLHQKLLSSSVCPSWGAPIGFARRADFAYFELALDNSNSSTRPRPLQLDNSNSPTRTRQLELHDSNSTTQTRQLELELQFERQFELDYPSPSRETGSNWHDETNTRWHAVSTHELRARVGPRLRGGAGDRKREPGASRRWSEWSAVIRFQHGGVLGKHFVFFRIKYFDSKSHVFWLEKTK